MIAMLKSLHFWRVWLVPHVLLVGGLALWGGDWRTLLAGVVFYTLISGFGAYRNYETDDRSVNRNLLGLLTWDRHCTTIIMVMLAIPALPIQLSSHNNLNLTQTCCGFGQ
jgi:hypothetical protein